MRSLFFDSAPYGNMQGDRAGVSRGHSRRRTLPKGGLVTGNEPHVRQISPDKVRELSLHNRGIYPIS